MYKETPLDETSINDHWEIRLHSIYFDDGSLIQVKQSLSIEGSVFGVNKKVFDFIVTKCFNKAIENNEWEISKNEAWEIFCDEDYDYNRFGSIHLIIGKWKFNISPVKLFKQVTKSKKKKLWLTVIFYKGEDIQFYLLLEGTNTIIYFIEKYKLGYYKGGNILDE